MNDIAFIELTGRYTDSKAFVSVSDISIVNEENGQTVVYMRAGHELKVKESLEDIGGILRKVLDGVWP